MGTKRNPEGFSEDVLHSEGQEGCEASWEGHSQITGRLGARGGKGCGQPGKLPTLCCLVPLHFPAARGGETTESCKWCWKQPKKVATNSCLKSHGCPRGHSTKAWGCRKPSKGLASSFLWMCEGHSPAPPRPASLPTPPRGALEITNHDCILTRVTHLNLSCQENHRSSRETLQIPVYFLCKWINLGLAILLRLSFSHGHENEIDTPGKPCPEP